jgi:hypothetical protein
MYINVPGSLLGMLMQKTGARTAPAFLYSVVRRDLRTSYRVVYGLDAIASCWVTCWLRC